MTAKKKPNKQKEVTAESFVRMAKAARKLAGEGEPGQTVARDHVSALCAFAEVLEGEAKALRGMR